MKYPPHILDEIRTRLPVSQVVGRKVALKKKGREWAGLSPFKVEKTPSFFVNDQKGFYHCFASGEHGDIFKFLMTTEGLTFPETVERLAQEAGVALPKPTVQDAQREDERQRLYRLVEVSAAFFREALKTQSGLEARRYIERRGLKRETIDQFGIGYSPASKTALKEHLTKQGFTLPEMVESGMLIGGEDIPQPYDRFRDRVMFPIADAKGRIIAFGGRALDPEAPAKYLNSPETPLFHKGHVLFNAHRARAAAHDKDRVIAVEGYMDAVALAEAGFAEAVAPLGTALTEDQLKLLWRMSNEPILCFDGDSAGRKAAFRAIDVALPLLEAGKSLMFAFLPDGLDPDDMVRQQGPEAMEGALKRARPLAEVLFDREWQAGDWSTPERRAGLEKALRANITKINDPAVRGHYGKDIAARLEARWGQQAARQAGRSERAPGASSDRWQQDRRSPSQFRGNGSRSPYGSKGSQMGGNRNFGGGPGVVPFGKPMPSASLVRSALVSGEQHSIPYREAALLIALVNHPWLLEQHAEDISELPLSTRVLEQLRSALLSAQVSDSLLDTATLRAHVAHTGGSRALSLVESAVTNNCDKFALPGTDPAEVEDGWRHALSLHRRHTGLQKSLEAAVRAWNEDASETAFERIRDLQQELERSGLTEDAAELPKRALTGAS